MMQESCKLKPTVLVLKVLKTSGQVFHCFNKRQLNNKLYMLLSSVHNNACMQTFALRFMSIYGHPFLLNIVQRCTISLQVYLNSSYLEEALEASLLAPWTQN